MIELIKSVNHIKITYVQITLNVLKLYCLIFRSLCCIQHKPTRWKCAECRHFSVEGCLRWIQKGNTNKNQNWQSTCGCFGPFFLWICSYTKYLTFYKSDLKRTVSVDGSMFHLKEFVCILFQLEVVWRTIYRNRECCHEYPLVDCIIKYTMRPFICSFARLFES